jgi:hypothetical protein
MGLSWGRRGIDLYSAGSAAAFRLLLLARAVVSDMEIWGGITVVAC